MSSSDNIKTLPKARLDRTIDSFCSFCEEEFEWRRNSGKEFDEPAYQEAMQLALGKLEAMKEGGAK